MQQPGPRLVRRSDPGPDAPGEVRITAIDVPFLGLTWFFVKASFAAALAFALTSWLWLLLGAGVTTVTVGLGWAAGLVDPFGSAAEPTVTKVAPATPPVVGTAAAEPVPEPEPEPPADEAPPPAPEPVVDPGPVDPNQAATEALMRRELERHRRRQQPTR